MPSSAWLDFKTVPEYDDLFSTECENVEAIYWKSINTKIS